MKAFDYQPEPAVLAAAQTALRSVPRASYSLPHDYPNSAPGYQAAPMAEREQPRAGHLEVYVHLPFCRYHCTFCYYAVRVGAKEHVMRRYVRALKRELEWVEPGTPLSQLYVGGGTPTAVPPDLLDEVLEAVFARTMKSGSHVHTVETSPETISPEQIAVLKRHGIGRVSMGVQSLDATVLDTIHREQTREQALAAAALLVQSGFVVNTDLIYGLPGQTEEMFQQDLTEVAAQGVNALTLYSLRTNERTPVRRVLAEDERFDLARLLRWRAFVKHCAQELGYTQTRWHTFKRLDTIARTHERLVTFDRTMWGCSLGVGMSARSQLGYAVYRNLDRLEPYVERVEAGQSPVEQVYPMNEPDRKTQFVVQSLGDGKPLERARYAATFGGALDEDYRDVLPDLVAGGLVVDGGESLWLSEPGRLLTDLITLAFYPGHAKKWLIEREARASLLRPPVTA